MGKGISPELLMMNQMMGMSMMMNNPMAMMGMGAGMMPGMAGMFGIKAAKKDEKKKVSGRIEDKVKRVDPSSERYRTREKEGVPETGTTTPPPPPPLQRPAGATPAPAPAPVQPKTAPPAIGPGSDAWKQKQNR